MLYSLINPSRQILILGDFNLCYLSERNHPIFKALEEKGFNQIVENPTHIKGRLIDLAFSSSGRMKFKVYQKAQYFTDHDMLEIR